jgi:hypothetical protein
MEEEISKYERSNSTNECNERVSKRSSKRAG